MKCEKFAHHYYKLLEVAKALSFSPAITLMIQLGYTAGVVAVLETENSIAESLNDLYRLRNDSLGLLSDAELIMNRTVRAQRAAAQAYQESKDLYSRTFSEYIVRFLSDILVLIVFKLLTF